MSLILIDECIQIKDCFAVLPGIRYLSQDNSLETITYSLDTKGFDRIRIEEIDIGM